MEYNFNDLGLIELFRPNISTVANIKESGSQMIFRITRVVIKRVGGYFTAQGAQCWEA